jgi:transcriptional regulator with XRE-family HTH domain
MTVDSKQHFDKIPTLGELMAEYPLSFSDLKEKSGVSRSALEDIVYGNTKNLQPNTMRAIASVFGREPKEIREFAIAIEVRKQRLGKNLPVTTLEEDTGRQNTSAEITALLLAS